MHLGLLRSLQGQEIGQIHSRAWTPDVTEPMQLPKSSSRWQVSCLWSIAAVSWWPSVERLFWISSHPAQDCFRWGPAQIPLPLVPFSTLSSIAFLGWFSPATLVISCLPTELWVNGSYPELFWFALLSLQKKSESYTVRLRATALVSPLCPPCWLLSLGCLPFKGCSVLTFTLQPYRLYSIAISS